MDWGNLGHALDEDALVWVLSDGEVAAIGREQVGEALAVQLHERDPQQEAPMLQHAALLDRAEELLRRPRDDARLGRAAPARSGGVAARPCRARRPVARERLAAAARPVAEDGRVEALQARRDLWLNGAAVHGVLRRRGREDTVEGEGLGILRTSSIVGPAIWVHADDLRPVGLDSAHAERHLGWLVRQRRPHAQKDAQCVGSLGCSWSWSADCWRIHCRLRATSSTARTTSTAVKTERANKPVTIYSANRDAIIEIDR